MKNNGFSPALDRLPHTVFIIMITGFLIFIFMSSLEAQMTSVVNSLADDESAHPFDNPNTVDIDESMDGFCGDEAGRCTFRAALEEAEALNLGAIISFNVSGTIQKSPLLSDFIIPEHSRINGRNQQVTIRGNGNDFLMLVTSDVHIKGLVVSNAIDGIVVVGPNNIIGGNTPQDRNIIINMSQAGINLLGNNNIVKGNFIGLNAQEVASGNRFGINIIGENNTIGGITTEDINVISGNDMGIASATFSGNTYIIGNFIGTNSIGDAARPNNVGINIIGNNTTVGGVTLQEANLIAGNNESGILVGVQSVNVAILGNIIGKLGSSLGAPNRDGIILGPGSFTTRVEKNRIRNNTNFGIHIAGLAGDLQSAAHRIGNNEIEGNNVGIMIQGNAYENVIGSPLAFDLHSNEINHNRSQGLIYSLGADGTKPIKNTVRKNDFHDNGNSGILIVTGQDGIEKPVITSFDNNGTVGTIVGTHPRAGSIIDVYTAERNSAGQYEGVFWLGKGVVSLDHTFRFSTPQSSQDTIVVTATDPDGNTSEFSDGAEVGGPVIVIQPPGHTNVPPPPPPPALIPFQYGPQIQFSVDQPGKVVLKILDMTGHELETIFNEYALPGLYDRTWYNSHYPAGIYIYQLSDGTGNTTIGRLIAIH